MHHHKPEVGMRFFTPLFATASLCLALSPSHALDLPKDEEAASFIASNVIGTFYHVFGHALIDVLDLPVLGRE